MIDGLYLCFNSMVFRTLKGFTATLDSLTYSPHLAANETHPYPFAYTITIQNDSKSSVTIFGRKWIVQTVDGSTQVVEGEGVVGLRPVIEPGTKFTYNSYHLVKDVSSITGTFFGKTLHGRKVMTMIPSFAVHPPQKA